MCNCQKIGNANKKGMQSFNEGRLDDAVSELQEAITLAGSLGTPIHEAKIRTNLALVLEFRGLTDAAKAQLRRALEQVEGKIGRANPLHAAITRQMASVGARQVEA